MLSTSLVFPTILLYTSLRSVLLPAASEGEHAVFLFLYLTYVNIIPSISLYPARNDRVCRFAELSNVPETAVEDSG